jgi:UDP-glucuronate 4-epimerase
MKILITGVAGFIGFHTAKESLLRGDDVVGVDNVNDYYDISLKEARLKELNLIEKASPAVFTFIRGNIANKDVIEACFDKEPKRVINLAAQAGVRKSLEDPDSYIESNIVGFVNILEACRHHKVDHLTYASTSSVYGLNSRLPFSEKEISDHPIQLYAASKRSNELLAHSYSYLFNLPTTGLRFFTVYGPWGRPDMALFLFTKSVIEGKPIKVFNHGNHSRDFTYIDDIVKGILLASDKPSKANPNWDGNKPDPSTSSCPYRVMNIGSGNRVSLENYISAIEDELGMKAKRKYLPLQPGDVPDSLADLEMLKDETGYNPEVSYKEGISKFIQWYKSYYKA